MPRFLRITILYTVIQLAERYDWGMVKNNGGTSYILYDAPIYNLYNKSYGQKKSIMVSFCTLTGAA